jgi:hypothetical protein
VDWEKSNYNNIGEEWSGVERISSRYYSATYHDTTWNNPLWFQPEESYQRSYQRPNQAYTTLNISLAGRLDGLDYSTISEQADPQ